MANVKHVGKSSNGQKIVVLYRTVPDEDHNCLVTETGRLPPNYHDRLMELVESEEGQQSLELADLLSRRFFADGENVLGTLHKKGFIKKVSTSSIMLTPNSKTSVPLNEVNALLLNKPSTPAKSVSESFKENGKPEQAPSTSALNNSSLAQSFISQAERYEKEAQALRKQAADLLNTTNDNDKPKPRRIRRTKTG